MRQLSLTVLILLALLIAMHPGGLPQVRSAAFGAETVRPIRISVAIKNRTLANPAQKYIRLTQGDVLELVFTADEFAELHLHGYDLYLNVEPGTPSVLRLDATITGRFPLESHRFGRESLESRACAHDHIVLLFVSIYPRPSPPK
jgi:hypothetical protein